jgi:hypothetical protein
MALADPDAVVDTETPLLCSQRYAASATPALPIKNKKLSQ